MFFNSILDTFLYDKNLAWFWTRFMKFLTPLIPKPWSWVCKFGPGLVPGQLLRTKADDINKLCHVLQVWYVWNEKQINWWTISISLWSKIKDYVTSSKPKKLVPGPYSTTWSYISLAYNKNMADEEKYLHACRSRVYNLHLIQISARYMHVW